MRSTRIVTHRLELAVALACAVLTLTALPTLGTARTTADPTPSRSVVHTAANARRGAVLWAEPLRTLTATRARATLRTAGFDDGQVRNGVVRYRLVYRTLDAHGEPTTASGLLALPSTPRRTLRLVTFDHGTEVYRGDAPSSAPDDFAAAPALQYAAAGFAAAAPDYLGLGVGPGEHPYFDIASETTASLDLLRAVRTFAASLGDRVAAGVDVTGFSQGASAALSLARALEQHADPYFRLHAAAAISGAYDFRRVELPAMLHGDLPGPDAVAYVAYLLVATNRSHPVYRAPGEIFRAPYDTRVETLFNGNVPGAELQRALPTSLRALLTPRGLALLTHPDRGLAAALTSIDGTCSWHPTAPVRLYRTTVDEQAVPANTDSCRAAFRAHEATVPVVDLAAGEYGGSRHLGSSVAGVTASLSWFRALER